VLYFVRSSKQEILGLLSIWSYWKRAAKPALTAEGCPGENGARRAVSFG